MHRTTQKRHPAWFDFTKVMKQLYTKSGCKMSEFTGRYPPKSHRPIFLMSATKSHGEKGWKRSDVDKLIETIGSQLSEEDVLSIDHAFKAACSLVESSELLPKIDVSEFIDGNGQIKWKAIDAAGADFARVFVVTEGLLERPWSLAFMKRLRDLMHESKNGLTTYQAADRLFLALGAISNGLMPIQARGSFEYLCWFHELIDGWIEDEAQPTVATVKSAIAGTSLCSLGRTRVRSRLVSSGPGAL